MDSIRYLRPENSASKYHRSKYNLSISALMRGNLPTISARRQGNARSNLQPPFPRVFADGWSWANPAALRCSMFMRTFFSQARSGVVKMLFCEHRYKLNQKIAKRAFGSVPFGSGPENRMSQNIFGAMSTFVPEFPI